MGLDYGCAHSIAAILVEPRAGGFVVTDDCVRLCPVWNVAYLVHITQLAALGAIGPLLCDVWDAEAVIAGIDWDLGRPYTKRSRPIDGKVLETLRTRYFRILFHCR